METVINPAQFLRACLFSAAALSVPGALVMAQESEHQHVQLLADSSLTLAAVVQAAVARAPQQQLSHTLAQVAKDQQQLSNRWISGPARVILSYRDDQTLDDTGLEEAEAGLEFDLWRRGEKANAKTLAGDQRQLVSTWQTYLQWLMAGEVRSVLHQLAAAEVKVTHARASIKDAERLLYISEKRFRAGDLPQGAVLQSEALVLEARQQLLETSAEQVDTQRRYSTLTGLSQHPAPLTEGLPALQEISDQHPQLQYLLARRQQLFSVQEQQRHQAAGNTTVSIGMRREQGSIDEDPLGSLGVAISVPFGGKTYSRASSSTATVAAVEADVQLQQARRELQQQLHETEHELNLQKESLDLASRSAELNRRKWQMAVKAFELGESDLQPVVLAQHQYRQNQLQLQLQKMRQQALCSSLKQVVGELP